MTKATVKITKAIKCFVMNKNHINNVYHHAKSASEIIRNLILKVYL